MGRLKCVGVIAIVHLLAGAAHAATAVPSYWMQENVGAVGVSGGTSIADNGDLLIRRLCQRRGPAARTIRPRSVVPVVTGRPDPK